MRTSFLCRAPVWRAVLLLSLFLELTGCAVNNFGYPTGFSTQKMNPQVDPRQDFNHYAAGRWLDAANLTSNMIRVSSFDTLAVQVNRQILGIIDKAKQKSASAPKGSPMQQVGDFYLSGLDEKRLIEQGVAPIQPWLKQIAASKDHQALAKTMAKLTVQTQSGYLIMPTVSPDYQNQQRYAIYINNAPLGMITENYQNPEAQAIRYAYQKMVADFFMLAGSSREQAQAAGAIVLAMESRIAAKQLTPAQWQNPHQVYTPMHFSEAQALLSNLDLASYFHGLGLPTDTRVIVTDREAMRERNAILGEYSLADTQTYLRWVLLRQTYWHLTPAFNDAVHDYEQVVLGQTNQPNRRGQVAGLLPALLGHPLSQLYVAKYFPATAKQSVVDLAQQIKAEFRTSLSRNNWLSAPTRDYALQKLDKLAISVAYPEKWENLSAVEIRRDDFSGNIFRINAFQMRRSYARLGQPVQYTAFNIPGKTLPLTANAGYLWERNAIEIPAALLQAPFFDVQADAAVNYCTIGAIIGHELTHGFDTLGRHYDADGNLRNWWTDEDAQKFEAETKKLVQQANAYAPNPWVKMNGQLTVGENLADVGGLSFGMAALKTYLRAHPDENRKIDGLSPEQRCFIAWGQIWADKARESWLKQRLLVDPHPTGAYRMASPAQHIPEFYEAFGIQPGDPQWLPLESRVHVW